MIYHTVGAEGISLKGISPEEDFAESKEIHCNAAVELKRISLKGISPEEDFAESKEIH
jgi:hypothetical protein